MRSRTNRQITVGLLAVGCSIAAIVITSKVIPAGVDYEVSAGFGGEGELGSVVTESGAPVTETGGVAAVKPTIDPLDVALGIDEAPASDKRRKELQNAVDQIFAREEDDPKRARFVEIQIAIDARPNNYYLRPGNDPRFAPAREFWTECMGGRFATRAELSDHITQLSLVYDENGETSPDSAKQIDELVAASDRCADESVALVVEPMREVQEAWIAENRVLIDQFVEALR